MKEHLRPVRTLPARIYRRVRNEQRWRRFMRRLAEFDRRAAHEVASCSRRWTDSDPGWLVRPSSLESFDRLRERRASIAWASVMSNAGWICTLTTESGEIEFFREPSGYPYGTESRPRALSVGDV